jgi:excisionase family DNA binding protein
MKDYISTTEAARAIGVSESSVKRWCDLGILAAVKTAGGHRRMPVREVIRFVREEDRTIANAELLGLPRQTGRKRHSPEVAYEELLEALRAGDENQFRRNAIDLFLAGFDISMICDQVLVPVLAAIGELWHTGGLEIFEEHRSCEMCTRLLHGFRFLLPEPTTSDPLAIGASVEGDPYTLPGQMAELIFLEAGWQVISLGNSLPIASLIPAVEQLKPSVFWMTLSNVADPESFLKSYRPFAESLQQRGSPLIVGGRALTADLRKHMRFSSFGDNFAHLRSFADTFRSMLDGAH